MKKRVGGWKRRREGSTFRKQRGTDNSLDKGSEKEKKIRQKECERWMKDVYWISLVKKEWAFSSGWWFVCCVYYKTTKTSTKTEKEKKEKEREKLSATAAWHDGKSVNVNRPSSFFTTLFFKVRIKYKFNSEGCRKKREENSLAALLWKKNGE